MHQFLDQLLNNPPAKKRSQTQTNSQIVRRNSEQQLLQQLNDLQRKDSQSVFQRKDSQPVLYSSGQYQNTMMNQNNSSILSHNKSMKQPQDESSEYEVEEITEQIVFGDDGGERVRERLNGFLPKVKESLAQLSASRQQEEQQQVLEVQSPSQYKNQQQPHNQNPNSPSYPLYTHALNRRHPTQPYNPTPINPPSSKLINSQIQKVINRSLRSIPNNNDYQRGSINLRTVQELINGINSAKQFQMELIKQFELQKQCFAEFINIVMVKIQLEIKRVLQKANHNKEQLQQSLKQQLRQSLRQQFQYQYQQKLSQQKSLLHQQKQYSLISRKQLTASESEITTQRKWQIQKKLIKQQLQQRYQYRLQKLQQQLQQQHKYSQQLIRTYQQSSHKPTSSIKSSRNITNKNQNPSPQLDEHIQSVKKQLQQKDNKINELQTQIQRLNEHIFDVEQKVEGIELEVENRVREKVRVLEVEHQKALQEDRNAQNGSNSSTHNNNNLHTSNNNNPSHTYTYNQSSPIPQLNPILQHSSHLQQSSRLIHLQSTHSPTNHLHQQLTQLQLQNQHLKKIIIQLQNQKNSIELQLEDKEKIISFRQEQVKKNQEDIAYEWAEVEKERQVMFVREQELVTAEQNISSKISQLRAKQLDLDKWQTQLQNRQLSLDLKQHQLTHKPQHPTHQPTLHHKQLPLSSKQPLALNQHQSISLTSNPRLSRQHLNDFYTQGGGGSFRPNNVEIPQLTIGRRNYYQQQQKQQVGKERSFDVEYAYRNNNNIRMGELVGVKGNFEKSFQDVDMSYTRQNRSRQRIIITSTNFRSTRANPNTHQFILPQQTSKAQRHSRSKSRSKQKPILRNNLLNGSSSISTNSYKNPSFRGKYIDEYYQNKQTNNLDGLGSKLERLRDEIKREIDSIK